jgi:RND family efflux transporter MFP subunit
MRIVATVSLMAILAGCQTRQDAVHAEVKSAPPAASIAVKTAPAAIAEWPTFFESTGTVRARTSSRVASRVMSYVREVRANVGSHVRAGQVLIVLDARDMESGQRRAEAARTEARTGVAEADHAVEAARANLDLAESTFRRMKDVYEKKSLSPQEFDEASARVRTARASLDMAAARRKQVDARIGQTEEEVNAAQIQSTYTTLSAPITGVVTEKMVEPGNLAVPGAPLLTIEQERGFRLEASVEEANLSKVKLGQSVEVALDAADTAVSGKVTEIVPAVDPGSRSFLVKIDLPASTRPRSGMFGRARFASATRKVLAIPAAAVVERGQMQWIFVEESGAAHARLVTIGARYQDQVEVLSGVSSGERIIAPVPAGLVDGGKVSQ